jgi:hypothetical protein
MFAERLGRFRIHFCIFTEDASALSKNIRNGVLAQYGVPAGITFDRIDVANLFESSGIPNNLTDWAPFLKDNKYATLMCCQLDWVTTDNTAVGLDEGLIAGLTAKMIKDGRVC